MSYRGVALDLTAKLELDSPPIALAFVTAPPAGVESFEDEVPSACSFWIRAQSGVFYSPAEKHFNCPIGAMTMGFEMPPAVQEQLGGLVEKMCTCEYIGADEPAQIPSVKGEKSGIVYGPLQDFPLAPDLVLMWLSPRQAMFDSEAVGKNRWTSDSPTAERTPDPPAHREVMDRFDCSQEEALRGVGPGEQRHFSGVE